MGPCMKPFSTSFRVASKRLASKSLSPQLCINSRRTSRPRSKVSCLSRLLLFEGWGLLSVSSRLLRALLQEWSTSSLVLCALLATWWTVLLVKRGTFALTSLENRGCCSVGCWRRRASCTNPSRETWIPTVMWFSGALATYPRLGVLSLRACGGNGKESDWWISCVNSGTRGGCEAGRWSMLALLGVCILLRQSLASDTQHL